jgi:hypothetical protein
LRVAKQNRPSRERTNQSQESISLQIGVERFVVRLNAELFGAPRKSSETPFKHSLVGRMFQPSRLRHLLWFGKQMSAVIRIFFRAQALFRGEAQNSPCPMGVFALNACVKTIF